MKTTIDQQPAPGAADTTSQNAPRAVSWWLEDPFGSVVTGILAPTAAVAVLAAVTFGLASTY